MGLSHQGSTTDGRHRAGWPCWRVLAVQHTAVHVPSWLVMAHDGKRRACQCCPRGAPGAPCSMQGRWGSVLSPRTLAPRAHRPAPGPPTRGHPHPARSICPWNGCALTARGECGARAVGTQAEVQAPDNAVALSLEHGMSCQYAVKQSGRLLATLEPPQHAMPTTCVAVCLAAPHCLTKTRVECLALAITDPSTWQGPNGTVRAQHCLFAYLSALHVAPPGHTFGCRHIDRQQLLGPYACWRGTGS
jgi:hypothetical protein